MSKIEPTNAHLQEACDLLGAETVMCRGFTLPNDADHYAIVALARLIANQQPAIAPELVDALQEAQKMADLIAIVDQGCGGNLNPTEMAYSAMRQARNLSSALQAILAELDALKPVDPLVDELAGLIPVIDYDPPETPAEAVARHLRARFHITEIQP